MSDSPLDQAELESIQQALRAAAPARSELPDQPEATPMPLFAAERDAAAARPTMTDLVQRWSRRMTRVVRSYLGEVELTAMSTETLDAAALVDELRTTWLAMVATDRGGHLIVAIGGELIEAGAARRCGAAQPTPNGREPSAIALRLFAPIGDAVVATLPPAWDEMFRTELARIDASADAVSAALGRDAVLAATIMVSGPVSGRVRLFARPEIMAPVSAPSPTVPADAQAIAKALGSVPVEVRVELATLRLRWSQLSALTAGTQLTLPVFVDEPLPIYCGDVLKAWGRPVVTRGVLAVEIAALHAPGGSRP